MMVFDNFQTLEGAEAFVAEAKRLLYLNGAAFSSFESGNQYLAQSPWGEPTHAAPETLPFAYIDRAEINYHVDEEADYIVEEPEEIEDRVKELATEFGARFVGM